MKPTLKILIMLLGCFALSDLHAAAAAAAAPQESKSMREYGAVVPFDDVDAYAKKYGQDIYKALNACLPPQEGKGKASIADIVCGYANSPDEESVHRPTLVPLFRRIIHHATNPFTNTLYAIIADANNPAQTQVVKVNLLTREKEVCANFPASANRIYFAKNNKLIIIDRAGTVFLLDPSNPLAFKKTPYPLFHIPNVSPADCTVSPERDHFIISHAVYKGIYLLNETTIEKPKQITHTHSPSWISNDHIRVGLPRNRYENYDIASLLSGSAEIDSISKFQASPEMPPMDLTNCLILDLNHPESGPDISSVKLPDHKPSHRITNWDILGSNYRNCCSGRTHATITDKYIHRGTEKGIEIRKLSTTEPSNDFLIPLPQLDLHYISEWTPVRHGAVIRGHSKPSYTGEDLYLLSWESPLPKALDYGRAQTRNEDSTASAWSSLPNAAARAIAASASSHSALIASEDSDNPELQLNKEEIQRNAFRKKLHHVLTIPAVATPKESTVPAKRPAIAIPIPPLSCRSSPKAVAENRSPVRAVAALAQPARAPAAMPTLLADLKITHEDIRRDASRDQAMLVPALNTQPTDNVASIARGLASVPLVSPLSERAGFSRELTYRPTIATASSASSQGKKIPSPEDIKKAALKKKLLFGSALALASYVGLRILTSPKAR